MQLGSQWDLVTNMKKIRINNVDNYRECNIIDDNNRSSAKHLICCQSQRPNRLSGGFGAGMLLCLVLKSQ